MAPETNFRITRAFAALVLLLMIMFLVPLQTVASGGTIALEGCQEDCGGIAVPYPFGIGPNCSLKGFELSCNKKSGGLTTLFLQDTEVLNISLSLGQVRVNNQVSSFCYNHTTRNIAQDIHGWSVDGTPFMISTPFMINNEKNKFMAIGFNTLSIIEYWTNPYYQYYLGGCLITDSNKLAGDHIYIATNLSCSGMDCCQTSIPAGTFSYSVGFDMNYYNISHNSNSRYLSWCTYAMVMENGAALQLNTENYMLVYGQQMPLVLDWAIGKETCVVAKNNISSYECRSSNRVCIDSGNQYNGYICNCSDGYEGNPYLEGGCQDINECAQNPCNKRKCHNLPGSYSCSCPVLMRPKQNATLHECQLYVPYLIGAIITLGFITGVIILVSYFAIAKHIQLFEKRRQEKIKRNFFLQNQGLLLQQLIDSHEDTTQKMRIFSLDELEKATNRFDDALILGRGGHGEVYKGILSDQRVVVIKRSKIVDKAEIEQFINEVVILSHINHRNVVKLFGCCLETEVPLLVYEFISNGTLFRHLHVEEHCSLTWKHRLRIALEAAGAISYLHSSASISVFHRDIKSSNILLDDYFTAKVSDFGASRSVQIDQTGITTAIQGTLGYMDPEYYCTGRLTQKSDVYSFGVILTELLTREKPLFSSRMFEGGSLIAYFSSAMNNNRLFEVLDPEVVYEENRTELEAVAKLAETCLRMKGAERPTMKEVEMQLEALWRSNKRRNRASIDITEERKLMPLHDLPAEIDTPCYSFQVESI